MEASFFELQQDRLEKQKHSKNSCFEAILARILGSQATKSIIDPLKELPNAHGQDAVCDLLAAGAPRATLAMSLLGFKVIYVPDHVLS